MQPGICRISRWFYGGVMVALLTPAAMAQNLQEIVNNVDIPYVNKLQVIREPTGYFMRVTVTLQNKNEFKLKFRDAKFKVRFEGAGAGVRAGTTEVDSQEVRGRVGDMPGKDEMVLNVYAGPNNSETLGRLLAIVNIIGNPDVKPRMYVEGTSELGLELTRGWVFEEGKRFDVQLRFEPQFQRDVFLK